MTTTWIELADALGIAQGSAQPYNPVEVLKAFAGPIADENRDTDIISDADADFIRECWVQSTSPANDPTLTHHLVGFSHARAVYAVNLIFPADSTRYEIAVRCAELVEADPSAIRVLSVTAKER